jgi:hypothetical protein
MKIENDKYYTPKELSKYCINKTFELIGKENITDIIDRLVSQKKLDIAKRILEIIANLSKGQELFSSFYPLYTTKLILK